MFLAAAGAQATREAELTKCALYYVVVLTFVCMATAVLCLLVFRVEESKENLSNGWDTANIETRRDIQEQLECCGFDKVIDRVSLPSTFTRACEPELVPALRALNMRFVVYNPLAGGLLTGKHAGKLGSPGASDSGRGRFTGNQMYVDRFWNEAYFDAVDAVSDACAASGEAGARVGRCGGEGPLLAWQTPSRWGTRCACTRRR